MPEHIQSIAIYVIRPEIATGWSVDLSTAEHVTK
jgi:hypothetical protein